MDGVMAWFMFALHSGIVLVFRVLALALALAGGLICNQV